MSSLVLRVLDADVLLQIAQHLEKRDALSLSSTCRSLRHFLRSSIFSTYGWNVSKAPYYTIWAEIRHLYIRTYGVDQYKMADRFLYEFNANGLDSLHIRTDRLTHNLINILTTAINLHTLDLSQLCWQIPDSGTAATITEYEPLAAFPPMSCQPSNLKFCSRYDILYASHRCASRMRATRFSFATLLAQLDVSLIEHLEIGAEALSLPVAAAYTWTSLRELVITGYWVHPQDDPSALEDPRLHTPAWIFTQIHLGTFLVNAPQLRTLRVRCRYNGSLPHPHCMVLPTHEHPSGVGVVPMLDTFELYNPAPTDGIYAQLPVTLRSLSLLTHPHVTHDTSPGLEPELMEYNIWTSHAKGVLTPPDIVRILSSMSLPELRDLRLSFRELTDMHLCEFIAQSFPRLELLELHAETGPHCLWRAPELSACARALAPLAHLQILRLNTFRAAMTMKTWRWIQTRVSEDTPEQRARAGILMTDIVASLFGQQDHDVGAEDATKAVANEFLTDEYNDTAGFVRMDGVCPRWPSLREVWLPQTIIKNERWNISSSYRVWRPYDVYRDHDGRMGLNMDFRPSIQIEEEYVIY